MIRAVVFDFGNVLARFDKKRPCVQLAEHSHLPAQEIYDRLVGSDLEKRLESGVISSLAFCGNALRLAQCDLELKDMIRIWGNIFSPNAAADAVVRVLIRKKVPVGVLSNTNVIHWPYICELPVMKALVSYNAPMTLSYRMRCLKPDPRMFNATAGVLRTDPSQILYLDDIPEYVNAARHVGMEAEVYDCSKDPQRLEGILRAHNVL